MLARSATIEIFARLQHNDYIRYETIGSATIEIFARLQLQLGKTQVDVSSATIEIFARLLRFATA